MSRLIWCKVSLTFYNVSQLLYASPGDCWYYPVEDKAGSVQNNIITTGPFYQMEVDCAWQCRNTNFSDNLCWAFTYNTTLSGCYLHFVNESVEQAPSVTFLVNGHNYAEDSSESVLYVRICFEGMDDSLKKILYSSYKAHYGHNRFFSIFYSETTQK